MRALVRPTAAAQPAGYLCDRALFLTSGQALLYWKPIDTRSHENDPAPTLMTSLLQLDPSQFQDFLCAVVVVDQETLEILDANAAASKRYGYSREQLLKMKIADLRVPGEQHLVAEATEAMVGGPAIQGPFPHRTAAGDVIRTDVVSIPGKFHERPSIAALLLDATERVSAQTQARVLFDEMPIGTWIHDCDTLEILAVNDAAVAMYGYSREELLSMTLDQLRPDKSRDAVVDLFRTHPTGELKRVYRHQRKDGAIIDVEATSTPIPFGRRNARLGAGRDITQELAAEKQLRFLAYHDELTGLPKRASMQGIMEKAISHGFAAVFFIDFDSFKEINETFGHSFGDALLRQIAERLRNVPGVEVCRWGDDEFVLVAPQRKTQSHDDALVQIRTALAPSYEHEDQTFFITSSIGIALYPEHGKSAEDLIRNADTAMYEAKRIKNTSALFRPSMTDAAKQRLYVQNGLHEALRSDHLRLSFQPIVSAGTGMVVAAEALIRWHDPERGVQMPDTFIAIAERTGLILPIGDWVVSEACRSLQALRSLGLFIPISVNVASQQVETNQIIESVRKWTAAYDVPAQSLNIEITESGIMRDIEHAVAVLQELRGMGTRIALDDFGAGYSLLGHLKSLPLDFMKIDKSLVCGIAESERDRQIMTSVLQLAKATDLFVIAEGVETAEQAQVLQSLGCDTLQGFHYSRPLYAAEFYDFVGERGPTSESRSPL